MNTIYSALSCGIDSPILLKFTRIMKLTIILLTAILLEAGATGYGQKINLTVKATTLENVLKEIKKQAGYNILYNPVLLKEANLVTLDINGASLESALQRSFEGQPVTYVIEKKTIVVKNRPVPAAVIRGPDIEPQKITVTGTIRDRPGKRLQYRDKERPERKVCHRCA
jgi:hypothetical protein